MRSYKPTGTPLRKCAYAVLLALGSMSASAVYAAEEDNKAKKDDILKEEKEVVERVTVTGSRIKREEFSNASPIQIISGEVSRELG